MGSGTEPGGAPGVGVCLAGGKGDPRATRVWGTAELLRQDTGYGSGDEVGALAAPWTGSSPLGR